MIEFLRPSRRRSSRLSREPGGDAIGALRVLSVLCVMLALICIGLAVAYQQKVRQVACYAEAAELGLAPPNDCRTRR